VPGFPFIPPRPAAEALPAPRRPAPALYWPAVWAAGAAAAALVAGLLAWAPPRPGRRAQAPPASAALGPLAEAAPRAPELLRLLHGTRVRFLISPEQAAREARREGKLLFLLHLSGNFEDPRFT
jgi:hypothetical protein